MKHRREWVEKLAGVTFEGRQDILKEFDGEGLDVKLVPEPENDYDPNAIAVQLMDGRKVGYIGKAAAGFIAKHELKFARGGLARLKVDSFEPEEGKRTYFGTLQFQTLVKNLTIDD